MCFAGTSLESSETTCLSDEPLPGPSSECSTPKKAKTTEVSCSTAKESLSFEEAEEMFYKIYNTRHAYQTHYVSDNAISFIETQIRMSKRSKHGK